MHFFRCVCFLVLACLPITSKADENPDWTTPVKPFQIADHLYYVGSRDLAVFLVTTPQGNILVNANLPSSPPLIRRSVEELGFRWSDTKILLNGQAHFDHMGGTAEIIRETHAKNFVMDGDASVSETGGRTDFAFGPKQQFAPAHVDRVLHDGQKVELGGVTLVAHKTPGHTRGCTTWTLQVHVPGEPVGKLRDVVIVGGITVLSDYRLVDKPKKPASYPGIANDFAQTFRTLRALPCDIFLGAHGSYFDMLAKLAEMPRRGAEVWVDPAGYRKVVDEGEATFEKRLDEQERSNVARRCMHVSPSVLRFTPDCLYTRSSAAKLGHSALLPSARLTDQG